MDCPLHRKINPENNSPSCTCRRRTPQRTRTCFPSRSPPDSAAVPPSVFAHGKTRREIRCWPCGEISRQGNGRQNLKHWICRTDDSNWSLEYCKKRILKRTSVLDFYRLADRTRRTCLAVESKITDWIDFRFDLKRACGRTIFNCLTLVLWKFVILVSRTYTHTVYTRIVREAIKETQ